MELILASASPRRRELLTLVGYNYSIIVSEADENVPSCEPDSFVEQLARRKAEAVRAHHPDACVIGADTVVELSGRVIGKPKNRQDAFATLSSLRGRSHTVYTGVAVLSPNKDICFHDTTRVTFADMSDEEIWKYIDSGEPMDKAGAYGIQGPGAVFVERVEGCYFTVIGMPLPRLYKALGEIGIYPMGF